MQFLLFPLMALVSASLVFGGGATADAQVEGSAESKFPPLIQKIIEKFNLDPVKVEAVIEENKAEMQVKVEQKQTERLDKLVEKGKLTEAQKQALLAKRAEIKAWVEANEESFETMDRAELKQLLQAKREELKNWADEQGIELGWLGRYGLFGHLNGGWLGMRLDGKFHARAGFDGGQNQD